MKTEYAIYSIDAGDYVRELSEYTDNNRSTVKTFDTKEEAHIFMRMNDLNTENFVVEEV